MMENPETQTTFDMEQRQENGNISKIYYIIGIIQYCLLQEVYKDTKEVIRIRKSMKDRQRNAHKTKDRVTRTSLKTGGELVCCSGRVSSYV
jgi:hypothetical protein